MEKFLVVVFDIAKYPKFVDVELGYGFLSKFYAYYVFQILNLTSEKGSILLNRQLSAKGKPACTVREDSRRKNEPDNSGSLQYLFRDK